MDIGGIVCTSIWGHPGLQLADSKINLEARDTFDAFGGNSILSRRDIQYREAPIHHHPRHALSVYVDPNTQTYLIRNCRSRVDLLTGITLAISQKTILSEFSQARIWAKRRLKTVSGLCDGIVLCTGANLYEMKPLIIAHGPTCWPVLLRAASKRIEQKVASTQRNPMYRLLGPGQPCWLKPIGEDSQDMRTSRSAQVRKIGKGIFTATS